MSVQEITLKFSIEKTLEFKYLPDWSWKMNLKTYWNFEYLADTNLVNTIIYKTDKNLFGIKLCIIFRKSKLFFAKTFMDKQYIKLMFKEIDLPVILKCLNWQN